MAMPSSRFPPDSGSTQVWHQLDTERQQQAISVVAQMTFNVVKRQSEAARKEGDHAQTTHPCQAAQ
jgi:hypothetical protein